MTARTPQRSGSVALRFLSDQGQAFAVCGYPEPGEPALELRGVEEVFLFVAGQQFADLAQWEHGTLQAQLAQSKDQLVELMTQIEAKPDDMSCAVNAKRVLSGMRLTSAKKAGASRASRRG